MIEISLLEFSLLIEGFVLTLVVLVVWSILAIKRRRRDRNAARKLFEQIKHQSQTRLQTTGSFLSEKYRFEGDELDKAVKSIDQAEKRFIQKIIQVYLQRDAKEFTVIDAALAELIDAYKSLSPVMPDAKTRADLDSGALGELAELREMNTRLQEELSITKETMGNMISEFGNMFGGGHDHELAKHEVVEKMEERSGKNSTETEPEQDPAADTADENVAPAKNPVAPADDEIVLEMVEEKAAATESDAAARDTSQDRDRGQEEAADEDIDELLDGLDLSGGIDK